MKGRRMASCIRIVLTAVLCLLPLVAGGQPASAQDPPPSAEGPFIPIDQLPPQEQLASAPLLVAAYGFVMVALFVYVLSLARRLTAVQREVGRLEADLKRTGRG